MSYDTCDCGSRKASHAVQCRTCRVDFEFTPVDISPEQVAWVAGIIEGEGCFTGHSDRNDWWIAVRMTDEDTIARLQEYTGVGSINIEYPKGDNKICWAWRVHAKPHREWLANLIYPWLSRRRQARLKELAGII